MNDITTLQDFVDDGVPIEITIDVGDQSQQLLVNKSDTFEGCDIDTLRDKTFLNNINESTLLKLSPPNRNDFEQHIKHAAKPSSSLRTMDGLYKMLIPVQSTCRNPPSPPHMIHKLHPRKKGCNKNCYCEKREIPAMYDVAVGDPQANAVLHNTTHNLHN